MRMFIEVFVILCILTQSQFCAPVYPETDSTNVDHRSSILSLIKAARNCSAYPGLTRAGTSEYLTACDRPVPATLPTNYIDYGLVLCMVLKDAAQRVCETKNQDTTNFKANFTSDNFCDVMNKTFPEPSLEQTNWDSFLRGEFENSANCKQACIQGNLINPICEFILKANIFTMEKPYTTSTDIPSGGNPDSHVNSQAHGKGDDTNTSKHKFSKKTASAADSESPKLNDGSPKTDLAGGHNHSEADANGTRSHSKSSVKDNVEKVVQATNNNLSVEVTHLDLEHNTQGNVRKQAQITDSNKSDEVTHDGSGGTQDNVRKQEHITNVNKSDVSHQALVDGVQDNITKQEHIANSNKSDVSHKGSVGGVQDNVRKQEHITNSNKSDVSHQGLVGGMQDNITKQTNTANRNNPSDDATHQDSEGDVPNITKPAHSTSSNNKPSDEATHRGSKGNVPLVTKQPHVISSNKPSDEATHQDSKGNVQDVTKEALTTNSTNPPDDATHGKAVVSKENNQKPGAGKHEDSSRTSFSSDSKSSRPEHKNLAGADPSSYTENQNRDDGNEDPDMPTNANSLDTDIDQDDGDQDGDSINSDSPGTSSDKENLGFSSDKESSGISSEKEDLGITDEQIPKKTENHQEAAGNHNAAQFNQFGDAEDSHFYAYFMTMVVICIIGYLLFHNKQKILALALEGRSRRGTRRRPNTSGYRKLDSNLEEAVTSKCSTSVTHVIY